MQIAKIQYPNPKLIKERYDEYEYNADLQNTKVYFNDPQETYNHLMMIESNGRRLRFNLIDAAPNAIQTTEETIKYLNAFTDTDVLYTLLSDKVKEDIIIKSASAPHTFNFNVSEVGIVASFNEDGSFDYIDEVTQESLYKINAPYAYDANDNEIDVEVSYNGTSFTYTLLTTGSEVYPITLDPTIVTNSCWLAYTSGYGEYTEGSTSATIKFSDMGFRPSVISMIYNWTAYSTRTSYQHYCQYVFRDANNANIGSFGQASTKNQVITLNVPANAESLYVYVYRYNNTSNLSSSVSISSSLVLNYIETTDEKFKEAHVSNTYVYAVNFTYSFTASTTGKVNKVWLYCYNNDYTPATVTGVTVNGVAVANINDFSITAGDSIVVSGTKPSGYNYVTFATLSGTAGPVLIPVTIDLDLTRKTVNTKTIDSDTMRKDVANYSVDCDTERIVAALIVSDVSVDTLRKVTANSYVSSDTQRKTISETLLDVDLMRKTCINTSESIDTLRKAVISSIVNSDTLRHTTKNNTLDSDTLRKTCVTTSANSDTIRKTSVSNEAIYDITRPVVASKTVNSNTQRKTIRDEVINPDTLRAITNSQEALYDLSRSVILTDALNLNIKRYVNASQAIDSDSLRKTIKQYAADYDTSRRTSISDLLDVDTLRKVTWLQNASINFDTLRYAYRTIQFYTYPNTNYNVKSPNSTTPSQSYYANFDLKQIAGPGSRISEVVFRVTTPTSGYPSHNTYVRFYNSAGTLMSSAYLTYNISADSATTVTVPEFAATAVLEYQVNNGSGVIGEANVLLKSFKMVPIGIPFYINYNTMRKVDIYGHAKINLDTIREVVKSEDTNYNTKRKTVTSNILDSDSKRFVVNSDKPDCDLNRITIKSFNVDSDSLRKISVRDSADYDTIRITSISNKESLNTTRLVVASEIVNSNTQRKAIQDEVIDSDILRHVTNFETALYNITRRVGIENELSIDTFRYVRASQSIESDTSRKIIKDYKFNSDTIRKTGIKDTLDIDTLRKVVALISDKIDVDTFRYTYRTGTFSKALNLNYYVKSPNNYEGSQTQYATLDLKQLAGPGARITSIRVSNSESYNGNSYASAYMAITYYNSKNAVISNYSGFVKNYYETITIPESAVKAIFAYQVSYSYNAQTGYYSIGTLNFKFETANLVATGIPFYINTDVTRKVMSAENIDYDTLRRVDIHQHNIFNVDTIREVAVSSSTNSDTLRTTGVSDITESDTYRKTIASYVSGADLTRKTAKNYLLNLNTARETLETYKADYDTLRVRVLKMSEDFNTKRSTILDYNVYADLIRNTIADYKYDYDTLRKVTDDEELYANGRGVTQIRASLTTDEFSVLRPTKK